MATTAPAVKLTYDDYCAAPADERYELLDGKLIMVPAPNIAHQRVQSRLGRRLSNFIVEQELGELLYAPCDVLFSDTDVVQPDLLYHPENEHHTRPGGLYRGVYW